MSRSPSRTSCSGSRKSNGRIPISTCFSMGTSTRFVRVRGRRPGRSRKRSRARRKPENRTLLAGARIAAPMAMRKPTKKELTSVPIEHLDLEKTTSVADLADGLEPRPYSSREFLWEMGKIAAKDPQSLVGTCYRKGIPYFVPALNDSSIGIALAKHHHDRVKAKKTPIAIDSIKDNYEIAQVKLKSPRTGVFYVGGGTPKNYISQVEVIQEVMGYAENPHMYAAQITVDVPQWGGLSGCTFEESQSWGKFHKDAKMAQSLVDATIGLPLLIGYLLQKGVHKKRKQKKYRWKGEELLELN